MGSSKQLRFYSDAIVTTANTVLADNPLMNVRDINNLSNDYKQPLRVVIDRDLNNFSSMKLVDGSFTSSCCSSFIGVPQFSVNLPRGLLARAGAQDSINPAT